MIKLLKEKNKYQETIFLGVMTMICFGFSVFRLLYSDSKLFLFLNWNLFLAFIPWALTSLMIINHRIENSRLMIFIIMGSWLLFFPNAPYILTDLFHLRLQSTMPIWFDLVLILSFAWTGLLFGFLSLWDIEKILGKSLNKAWVVVISTGFLFLGSFGIYVGRYLRWNSWDIITEPFRLIYDLSDRIVNPFKHPGTWGLTLFMGIFLNMLYWSFRLIRKKVD